MRIQDAIRSESALRLDAALDEAASRLWDLPDGETAPEVPVARELIATIPPAERDTALWSLCHDRAWWSVGVGDGILNECEQSTYDAIDDIGTVLRDAIVNQGDVAGSLEALAAESIRRRYDLEHGLRDMRDAGVAI